MLRMWPLLFGAKASLLIHSSTRIAFTFAMGIIAPSRFDMVRQPGPVFASSCIPFWNLLADVSVDESSECYFRTRIVLVDREA